MAKDDDEAQQPELIPLTAEELTAAGPKLAALVKELEDMEDEHKDERGEQAKARKRLRAQITSLAGQIRTQGR